MISEAPEWLIIVFRSIKIGSEDFIDSISRDDITKWNDILTSIIGVSAAIGALALPIAINVIESTLNRYKSSTLVKLQNEISNTNLPRTNLWIFSSLAFAIILKAAIASNQIPIELTTTIALVFSLLFIGLVSDIYRFLNYTFTLVSDLEKIRKRIESLLGSEIKKNVKQKKERIKTQGSENLETTIISLFEIEAYEVSSNFDKQDLSESLRALLNEHVKTIDNKVSKRILVSALSSFPKLLKVVEDMRSVELYQRYADFYTYISARAICQNKDFIWIFTDLEKIARNREVIPPKSGRLCKSGRVLLNISHLKPGREVQQAIGRHFNNLIWIALEKDVEVLPELIEHCNSVFFYSRNSVDSWQYARVAPELWRYEGIKEIANAAKKCSSGEISFEEYKAIMLDQHTPRMKEIILQNNELSDDQIKEAFERFDKITAELIESVSFKELAVEIKNTVLASLISIYKKSPEMLISCRVLKNPAGSNIHNIGYNVVPSSLESCISELILEKNFQSFHRITSDTIELDIINGISVLMIYEMWGEYIVKVDNPNYRTRTVEDVAQSFGAARFKLREIKSAISRIDTLHRCVVQNLEHGGLSEELKITEKQKKIIVKQSKKLTSALKEKFKREIETKVKTGRLDENTIKRFYDESYEAFKQEAKNLVLFKSLKLGSAEGRTVTIPYPRVAFVEHDDTHYMFDNIARDYIRSYHGWMCERIISGHANNVEDSWPTTDTKLLLITSNAVDHLEKNGFNFGGSRVIWPNNFHECDFYITRGEGLLYSSIINNEFMIRAEFSPETGIPFSIKHESDEENVNFNFIFKLELVSK